jgi:hypothetical protein
MKGSGDRKTRGQPILLHDPAGVALDKKILRKNSERGFLKPLRLVQTVAIALLRHWIRLIR